MTSIVIGYDGSPRAEDAIVLGRALAEATAAQPIVVAAMRMPGYLMGPGETDQAVHAQLDPVLEVAADRLSGLEPRTEALQTRSVADGLMEVADRENAAAIVIGSSHHGPVGRIGLGSVGASLIHGSPCAVTVAQHGLSEEGECRLRKIGVAYDGSPEASSALETAGAIALRTHAELTIVTVAEIPLYAIATPPAVYRSADLSQLEEEEKRRLLDLAVERVPSGVEAEGRLLKGSAGRLLPEISSEFDLMVMGSRGYGPIGRTLLGGVATHVIHSSRCPVMVLPRGSGYEPFGHGASHEAKSSASGG